MLAMRVLCRGVGFPIIAPEASAITVEPVEV